MPRTAASDLAGRLVGREIRRARKELGLTQAEVSERMGTTPSYVANLEAGRVNPTVGQLARVAGALELDLEFSLRPIDFESVEVVEPALRG